jgi:hypothetical protein
MEPTETKKAISTVLLVLLTVISLAAISSVRPHKGERPAALSGGITEHYFIPEDENGRTWHIVNEFYPDGSAECPGYNNAEYTFSNDSVSVIVKYSGIQENVQTGFDYAQQNFIKK